MVKRLILFLIVLILTINSVIGGVTYPIPSNVELFPGESQEFKFQIQTITLNEDVFCEFSYDNNSPLVLNFSDQDIFVGKSSQKNIYGTVFVPKDTLPGEYTQLFCTSCYKAEDSTGFSLQIEVCNLPVNVKVIGDTTEVQLNSNAKKLNQDTANPIKTSEQNIINQTIISLNQKEDSFDLVRVFLFLIGFLFLFYVFLKILNKI